MATSSQGFKNALAKRVAEKKYNKRVSDPVFKGQLQSRVASLSIILLLGAAIS